LKHFFWNFQNQQQNRQNPIGSNTDYFPNMSQLYSQDDSIVYNSNQNFHRDRNQDQNHKPNKKNSKSSLLEEFRSSKNTSRIDLKSLVGHFVEFSGDQYGSRYIQQRLETASIEEKDLVFKEIYPQSLSLMIDVFGNYVIQKFFEHGTSEQKTLLGETLIGHVLELSLQMYGCRVVQKALEVIDPEQQSQLVIELEGHVLRCIKDQNGNHVIQKVIEQVSPLHTQFIVYSFVDKVEELAMHPYGCRVIQRILEHHGKSQEYHEPLVQIIGELLNCTINLVRNQYGNYVVQHVLKYGRPEDKHETIKKLRGKIVQYSQHKFASNVIEQCVEYGNTEQRQWIIDEIVAEERALEMMMKHQYANYVVQKILEVSNPQQRDAFIEFIKPHIQTLKKYTYGKHIISRLVKIIDMLNI